MNNLSINQNTRLSDDSCYLRNENVNNNILSNYNFQKYLPSTDLTRQEYFNSVNQQSVFQTGNFSGYKTNIDNLSSFQNGKNGNILTHSHERKIFNTSNYFSPMFKGPKTMSLNPDLMSRLMNGELTQDKVSTRGKTIDRFIPLLPDIQKEIQNPVHYIPKYWVNGGMDTRVVIRNSDYRKICGGNISK